jgi:predicted PolB exonuclease-like 3'-5' exonuclease
MKTLKDLVFLDIETVPQKQRFDELSEPMQKLWVKKSIYLKNEAELSAEELYKQRAGIYAEFGKIVCISIGVFYLDNSKKLNFRVKSIYNHDEVLLLKEFCEIIAEKFNSKKLRLCAHNGKEFDFPYICRRMILHNIKIPDYLDLAGKKPWEVKHIDTMELWKFGDRKSYSSLELLTTLFDIPTPKDDMDGSMVAHVYYEENNLEKIALYCNKDVAATAQVYLKFQNKDILNEDHIHFVS